LYKLTIPISEVYRYN